MKKIIESARDWQTHGHKVAMATVVNVMGAAPRSPGAKLIISENKCMMGSISGGCVEASVLEQGLEILENKEPRMLQYGISNDDAWSVGLSCGGSLEIFLEPLSPVLCASLHTQLQNDRSFVLITVINPPEKQGTKMLFSEHGEVLYSSSDADITRFAPWALAALENDKKTQYITLDNGMEFFLETHMMSPTLFVIGGVHIAIPLVRFAGELGFKTVVVDPRAAFANAERFPDADEICVAWPDQALLKVDPKQALYSVILSHDPKIDEPALAHLIRAAHGGEHPLNIKYIGAIGSRTTHAARIKRLTMQGVPEKGLKDIFAPVGLDLGATSPEEIAMSIMAEIIAVKNNRNGTFLRDGMGHIGKRVVPMETKVLV